MIDLQPCHSERSEESFYALALETILQIYCVCARSGNVVTGFHTDGTPPPQSYYETKFCHHLPEYFQVLFAGMSLQSRV